MRKIPMVLLTTLAFGSVTASADEFMRQTVRQIQEKNANLRATDLEAMKAEILNRGEVASRACDMSMPGNLAEDKIIPEIEEKGMVAFPQLIKDYQGFLDVSDQVIQNESGMMALTDEDLTCLYATNHLIQKTQYLVEGYTLKHKAHINSLRVNKYVGDKVQAGKDNVNSVVESVKTNLVSFGAAVKERAVDRYNRTIEGGKLLGRDIKTGAINAKNKTLAAGNKYVVQPVVNTSHAVKERAVDRYNRTIEGGKLLGRDIKAGAIKAKDKTVAGTDSILDSIGNWFINLIDDEEVTDEVKVEQAASEKNEEVQINTEEIAPSI